MYEQRGSKWSKPSESYKIKFHAAATFQAAGGQWRHGQASMIGRFWGALSTGRGNFQKKIQQSLQGRQLKIYILLMDKILHHQRMMTIPLFIGF